jgi:hypothetical protein
MYPHLLLTASILLTAEALAVFVYGLCLPRLPNIRDDFKRHERFCRISGLLIVSALVLLAVFVL